MSRRTDGKAARRRLPALDEWERGWQRHWSKVGTAGYELPAGGPGGAERDFLAHARTPKTAAVRARVHTLGGFSAHAGQTDLLAWLGAIAPSRPRVVLTHGEEGASRRLAQEIQRRYGLRAARPKMGDVIEL
jgi:predicted metal-dependent RNase